MVNDPATLYVTFSDRRSVGGQLAFQPSMSGLGRVATLHSSSRARNLALPQFCPRYTTVLQRTEDEGIGEDELDTMQLELENLLSNVSKRMRLLESALSCSFAIY